MSTQFSIRTDQHQGTTALFIPREMVDGPYDGLEQDLRDAGLLMNVTRAGNAHFYDVLGAPEGVWSEALRRWLTDRTPASLRRSLYPDDQAR